MEVAIFLLSTALSLSLYFIYECYTKIKELGYDMNDYEFCCDCISKFKDSEVEYVLVYSSEINMSRRLILIRMGYALTDEKEIPAARLPQLIKIQPCKSKIPTISIKECSKIYTDE